MALDDQAKTYTIDEVEELELNAKAALLKEIADMASSATAESVHHLAAAYANLVSPDTPHGSVG